MTGKSKMIVGEIYRVPNIIERLSIARDEMILDQLLALRCEIALGSDQNIYYLKVNNT